MTCFDRCTDKVLRGWWRSFKRCCPLIYRFLHGDHDQCLFLKHALGFPAGACLGFALHYFVLARLQLPPPLGPLFSFIIILSLALGFSASVQVRCISLLVLPHFFGKHGRAYVMTFALALLISGPIMNLMSNAREISRSMACVQSVLANQSKVKNDLRTRPVREVMMDMQEQGKTIDRTSKDLKKQFQPMKFEIQNDGGLQNLRQRTDLVDGSTSGDRRAQTIEQRYKLDQERNPMKKKEKKYERKLDYRCEGCTYLRPKTRYQWLSPDDRSKPSIHAKCGNAKIHDRACVCPFAHGSVNGSIYSTVQAPTRNASEDNDDVRDRHVKKS